MLSQHVGKNLLTELKFCCQHEGDLSQTAAKTLSLSQIITLEICS